MQRLIMMILMFTAANLLWAGEPGTHLSDAVNNTNRPEADQKLDQQRKPAEVMAFFGVEPGMNIVDIFAGDGYYTELLARAVGPEGKVTMHNNGAWMSYVEKGVAQRLKDNRLPNVVRFDKEVDQMERPEGKADMIFLVLSFHDLYYTDKGWPQIDVPAFLNTLKKGLAPDGVLAIVDHAATPGSGSEAAQKLHRIDPEFAKKVLIDNGFKFEGESNILRNKTDDYTIDVFQEKTRRKTDRFIYKFTKAG